MKDVIGDAWEDIRRHLEEDIARGVFLMWCVACDEEVDEPTYSVEDEQQRYPLCQQCEMVDVKLLVLSRIESEL
jgi:hypothetical protein